MMMKFLRTVKECPPLRRQSSSGDGYPVGYIPFVIAQRLRRLEKAKGPPGGEPFLGLAVERGWSVLPGGSLMLNNCKRMTADEAYSFSKNSHAEQEM